jgi:hypothetical protein
MLSGVLPGNTRDFSLIGPSARATHLLHATLPGARRKRLVGHGRNRYLLQNSRYLFQNSRHLLQNSRYLMPVSGVPGGKRSRAIALFYAVGTAIGGAGAPAFFGMLLETGRPDLLAIGYLLGPD